MLLLSLKIKYSRLCFYFHFQGISNPVPRIRHPDWLHKKILEKDDVLKQRKINQMFTVQPKKVRKDDHEDRDMFEDNDEQEDRSETIGDIEEAGGE